MTGTPGTSRIAVLDDYQGVAQGMADWGLVDGETVFFHDHVEDVAQQAARLAPFDVLVLTRERTRLGKALIEHLPRLKLAVSIGMANAAIDLEATAAHGVIVCGTSGGDSAATPNLTWALVLAITRSLVAEAASVRAGGWQVGIGYDLAGKTLALLGLGRIGQVVARYGQTFGMRAIAWSQNLTAKQSAAAGVEHVGRDELFARADILSIHVRLSERTRDLVGAREIALMKPTAYLVNTSRGPIVNEPALIAALQERRIAGAALDVFEPEPLPQSHPFRFLPNVLATPHIGYVSQSTYQAAFPQIVEAIRAWQHGAPIRVIGQ